jgi:hypothetical protein
MEGWKRKEREGEERRGRGEEERQGGEKRCIELKERGKERIDAV